MDIYSSEWSGEKLIDDAYIMAAHSTLNEGNITVNGTTELTLLAGSLADGNIELNDNSSLILNEGSSVEGVITKNDSARVEDYRFQISENDMTATADTVGMMRYRTTSTASYCEMVMQTGDTTYEWVTIIDNDWGS